MNFHQLVPSRDTLRRMRGLLVANTETALVARAILRETRTTPQKARRVVNIVRGERADTALTTLRGPFDR